MCFTNKSRWCTLKHVPFGSQLTISLAKTAPSSLAVEDDLNEAANLDDEDKILECSCSTSCNSWCNLRGNDNLRFPAKSSSEPVLPLLVLPSPTEAEADSIDVAEAELSTDDALAILLDAVEKGREAATLCSCP